MIKKLRSRFILIATVSVAAVMLLLTAVLNAANYASTNSDMKKTLELIYENKGTIPAQKPAEPSGEKPPEPSDGNRDGGPFTPETPFSTRFFVLMYRSDGTLVKAELDRIASVGEDDTQEYLTAAIKKGEGYGYYGNYRFFVAQLDDERNMAIFLDCYQQLRAMRILLFASLAADAACTMLVFILVVLLSRRAIDPVVRAAEKQKQFITDASHELKTPITVIATSLRVLEMETGKQKWIDKARTQTEKLTELVNSLVALSRMDEERSPLRHESFDISAAVGETAESFADFALSQGHELRISATPDCSYCGDEYAVRQMVSILLDNAVKYALPDTPIEFALERAHRGVVIRTKNRCANPESIDPKRLFDRFYRADKARGAGGFGIGLSMAQSIAEGHNGSASAEVKGDELEITVRLR